MAELAPLPPTASSSKRDKRAVEPKVNADRKDAAAAAADRRNSTPTAYLSNLIPTTWRSNKHLAHQHNHNSTQKPNAK